MMHFHDMTTWVDACAQLYRQGINFEARPDERALGYFYIELKGY